jgi:three-Cys-motif partner protein
MGDSQRLALTSPTRILGLDSRFDRYVFCDLDETAASALRIRAARDFPDREVQVHQGDANALALGVATQLPPKGTLSFCFLDPFRMDNLRFATVEALASRRMDFLVLIPSGMDGNRNEGIYVKAKDKHVEQFCGAPDWRDRWAKDKETKLSFGDFIAKEFGRSMTALGYIDPGLEQTHPVHMDEKNVLLYRLALYSKSQLGTKFWGQTKHYGVPQMNLGFN